MSLSLAEADTAPRGREPGGSSHEVECAQRSQDSKILELKNRELEDGHVVSQKSGGDSDELAKAATGRVCTHAA